MRRLVVLLAISAGVGAFGLTACGGGSDKPPMTPDDSEHMTAPAEGDLDAGADPAPAPEPDPEADPA
jgi:hypothetical protein